MSAAFINLDFIDVHEFHKKFELPGGYGTYSPGPMPTEQLDFRVKFLLEELFEFERALGRRDLVKLVDSILDLTYVAFGTLLFAGIDPYRWSSAGKTSIRMHQLNLETVGWPDLSRVPPHLPDHIMASNFMRIVRANVLSFQGAHWWPGCGERTWEIIVSQHLWNIVNECYSIAARTALPWGECWDAVQQANMAKVRAASDGSNSKRSSPFDVIKPTGWVSPEEKIHLALKALGANV